MPTTPCLIHSQATLPTFRMRDGGTVFVSNGCCCQNGARGVEVVAWSGEAEAWLRANVPMSEPLALLLQRLRWMSFDSRATRERNG